MRNTIVELRLSSTERREINRTISKMAVANHGIDRDELLREFDPNASGEFFASHARGLEALRQDGMVAS
ncbi:DUF3363 domain-containing protein [Bradyrhizobium sp. CCGUVB4N]|uniref:DUF3363 domain-containing protein n=1 Tax=Bradyrhizobium sp. CCGUVB4N TaxID=2949631 RepID=UPI0035C6FD15